MFLDPNETSADGTVAITSFVFSGDAKMVAYSFSTFGADWNKLKVRNVETGEDYPETLVGLKLSTTSWTSDNKGFFYNVSIPNVKQHRNFLPKVCFISILALS